MSNWFKVCQTDLKWEQTDLKCVKLIKSEQNLFEMCQTVLKWAKLI